MKKCKETRVDSLAAVAESSISPKYCTYRAARGSPLSPYNDIIVVCYRAVTGPVNCSRPMTREEMLTMKRSVLWSISSVAPRR